MSVLSLCWACELIQSRAMNVESLWTFYEDSPKSLKRNSKSAGPDSHLFVLHTQRVPEPSWLWSHTQGSQTNLQGEIFTSKMKSFTLLMKRRGGFCSCWHMQILPAGHSHVSSISNMLRPFPDYSRVSCLVWQGKEVCLGLKWLKSTGVNCLTPVYSAWEFGSVTALQQKLFGKPCVEINGNQRSWSSSFATRKSYQVPPDKGLIAPYISLLSLSAQSVLG